MAQKQTLVRTACVSGRQGGAADWRCVMTETADMGAGVPAFRKLLTRDFVFLIELIEDVAGLFRFEFVGLLFESGGRDAGVKRIV